jgi:hypothetical protein
MDVLAAEQEDVVPCVRKRRAADAVPGDEDVAVAVVVEDPAVVPLEEVAQVEIALVLEAPDPLAGVVEVAGPALRGSAARIDVEDGSRGGRLRRRRGRLGRARRERQNAKDDRGLDASAHVAQYGLRSRGRPGGDP